MVGKDQVSGLRILEGMKEHGVELIIQILMWV